MIFLNYYYIYSMDKEEIHSVLQVSNLVDGEAERALKDSSRSKRTKTVVDRWGFIIDESSTKKSGKDYINTKSMHLESLKLMSVLIVATYFFTHVLFVGKLVTLRL